MLNAFTVDVEDYFQVGAFADRISTAQWDDYPDRVEANTRAVLKLLDRHSVRATFFILGWTARKFPHLVTEIQRAGHEIGSHSFWHQSIYELTPEQFAEDLRDSCDVLAQITSQPVTSYRAPSFSVTNDSLWALEILMEAGIEFDSSIFPIYHDRYGIPGAEPFPYCIKRESGRLWEFPPSIYRTFGYNLPIAGGGYFRLYPAAFSISCLRKINTKLGRPFMFYIHPWELDPDQPRLPGKLRSKFRHYQNLRSTQRKLDRLLSTFEFGTMTDALRSDPELSDQDFSAATASDVLAEPIS